MSDDVTRKSHAKGIEIYGDGKIMISSESPILVQEIACWSATDHKRNSSFEDQRRTSLAIYAPGRYSCRSDSDRSLR